MNPVLNTFITTGAWLLIPIVALIAYDKIYLEPRRGVDEAGEPIRPPHYINIAYWAFFPAIIAVGKQLGPQALVLLQPVVIVLSYLAIPLVLFAAYDKWVLEPQRPRGKDGQPAPGPWYTRLAHGLLLFAILAFIVRIGVPVVFAWVKDVSKPLSYFAVPIGLWCLFDSWFLAPRRHVLAGTAAPPEPPALTRGAYFVLPVLVVAVIVRMISAETLDFSLVLFLLALGTGVVWALDHFFFRKRREAEAAAVQPMPITLREPGTVDYARSFFPVAFIVLVVRAFIFEPFRIPSDSMMPTLLDGDFIVVNKFAYGLRWPVLNTKFVDFGDVQRGDVVVFRHPPHPETNFIKRLVGLPGDRLEVHDDHLVINGETIALQDAGRYTDGCYVNVRLSTETVGTHTHHVMSCRTQFGLQNSFNRQISGFGNLPDCDRKGFREKDGRKICLETPAGSAPDSGDHDSEFRNPDSMVVPAGYYVAIGDNRDNSADSRDWGLVPEQNLVGKATRIWFNFDLQRSSWVDWSRIGKGID